ncbi:TPA: hypothetical protein ACX6NV_003990 [Photobacterium damselae]
MTYFIDDLIVEPLSRYIEQKYTKADAPRLLKNVVMSNFFKN